MSDTYLPPTASQARASSSPEFDALVGRVRDHIAGLPGAWTVRAAATRRPATFQVPTSEEIAQKIIEHVLSFRDAIRAT
jgi:hypothetical protein